MTEIKHGTDEYYRQYIPDWDERNIRHIEFEKNPFEIDSVHYTALKNSQDDFNRMLKEDVDVFKNVNTQKWMVYCRKEFCGVKLAELTTERPKFSIVQLNEIYYQKLHRPY